MTKTYYLVILHIYVKRLGNAIYSHFGHANKGTYTYRAICLNQSIRWTLHNVTFLYQRWCDDNSTITWNGEDLFNSKDKCLALWLRKGMLISYK